MTSFGFGCVRMTSEGLCYLAAAACGPGIESQGRARSESHFHYVFANSLFFRHYNLKFALVGMTSWLTTSCEGIQPIQAPSRSDSTSCQARVRGTNKLASAY